MRCCWAGDETRRNKFEILSLYNQRLNGLPVMQQQFSNQNRFQQLSFIFKQAKPRQSSRCQPYYLSSISFIFISVRIVMKQQGPHYDKAAFQQLKQFGFEEANIIRALQITSDLQKASEIALKLADEGPLADLSAYYQPKKQQKLNLISEYDVSKFTKKTKMIFIVNAQLKMGKGKVCAQVGHAVIGAFVQMQEQARYDERARVRLENWEASGTMKVVVKAETEKELFAIKKQLQDLNIGMNLYLVEDAGHTQIKAGSKTVLGVGPAFAEQIDPVTQHLKLL